VGAAVPLANLELTFAFVESYARGGARAVVSFRAQPGWVVCVCVCGGAGGA
jgi:hypothetical protein